MATKTPKTKETASSQTMEELLAKVGKIKTFKRNDPVVGKVSAISGRTVYVDIGGKTEAVVGEKEYDLSKDYLKTLKVGDEVKAIIVSPESESGHIILSLKRAAADSKWKVFEQALEKETVLTTTGREYNKGGLLVEIDGVYGFIPASQFSKDLEGDVDKLVGQTVKAKVIEVDRSANRLVLSERAVSEAVEIAARKEALSLVKEGEIYEGTIVGLVPFGAFVTVKVGKGKKAQELEGLVHISEISWEKIEEVTKSLKEGDKVKVKIIGTDEENGKLALSMKRLSDDPWNAMAKKYLVDSKHKGRIVKVAPFGIFVHLDKGIEGLIHASKMPTDMTFKEGESVDVFVESVDVDKRRLSLGVVLSAKPVGYK